MFLCVGGSVVDMRISDCLFTQFVDGVPCGEHSWHCVRELADVAVGGGDTSIFGVVEFPDGGFATVEADIFTGVIQHVFRRFGSLGEAMVTPVLFEY